MPVSPSLPSPALQHQHQHHHRQRHGNHCQHRDVTTLSWALYIERHGLSDVWNPQPESETDRYGPRTRKVAGNTPGELTVDDKSGQCPYLYNQVPYVDCRDPTVKQILVTKTLQGTRYYLGHCGGEFVFRYWPSRQSAPYAFLGSTGATTQGNFQFCGQVPRPRPEYSERFSVVKSKVVRMCASILGHLCTHDHGRLPGFLRTACKLGGALPQDGIEDLGIKWDVAFPNGARIPDEIRVATRLNPAIAEFAHLVQILAKGRPDVIRDLEPLVRMVEGSTQLPLRAIARNHYARLEEEAFKQLFSGEYSHNLLVFQDDKVMDVHAFYEQPRYQTDPLHPSRFHQFFAANALPATPTFRFLDWNNAFEDEDIAPFQEVRWDTSEFEFQVLLSHLDDDDDDETGQSRPSGGKQ